MAHKKRNPYLSKKVSKKLVKQIEKRYNYVLEDGTIIRTNKSKEQIELDYNQKIIKEGDTQYLLED